MRTANLTGALLDYWTARAEGAPADQLEIRPVQRPDPRTPDTICVRCASADNWCKGPPITRYDPSTNWATGGPLLETYSMDLENLVDPVRWRAVAWANGCWTDAEGDTPLIAICRAVVRAAFGDEVEDLPCA